MSLQAVGPEDRTERGPKLVISINTRLMAIFQDNPGEPVSNDSIPPNDSIVCLLTYKCLHGLAPDYLSRFCTLLTSVTGRPLLHSADANKLLVPRSCMASFGLRFFSSSGQTAWNDMPAHLCNLDLSLSDFRQLLKTALFQTVPV